jgi:hypothetical protein
VPASGTWNHTHSALCSFLRCRSCHDPALACLTVPWPLPGSARVLAWLCLGFGLARPWLTWFSLARLALPWLRLPVPACPSHRQPKSQLHWLLPSEALDLPTASQAQPQAQVPPAKGAASQSKWVPRCQVPPARACGALPASRGSPGAASQSTWPRQPSLPTQPPQTREPPANAPESPAASPTFPGAASQGNLPCTQCSLPSKWVPCHQSPISFPCTRSSSNQVHCPFPCVGACATRAPSPSLLPCVCSPQPSSLSSVSHPHPRSNLPCTPGQVRPGQVSTPGAASQEPPAQLLIDRNLPLPPSSVPGAASPG